MPDCSGIVYLQLILCSCSFGEISVVQYIFNLLITGAQVVLLISNLWSLLKPNNMCAVGACLMSLSAKIVVDNKDRLTGSTAYCCPWQAITKYIF